MIWRAGRLALWDLVLGGLPGLVVFSRHLVAGHKDQICQGKSPMQEAPASTVLSTYKKMNTREDPDCCPNTRSCPGLGGTKTLRFGKCYSVCD